MMRTQLWRGSYSVVFLAWVVALTGSLLVSPVQASIYGPGGLLLNPTADMPEKGSLAPSALAIRQDGAGILANRRTLATYGLTYGLTDDIEVGVAHVRLNPTNPPKADPSNGASIKWRLLRGHKEGRPDVVIGGNFLSGGDVDAKTLFVATRFATGEIGRSSTAHLHLGLMYAGEEYGIKRRDWAPYAGIDIPLAKRLRAFAEVRQRLSAAGGGAGNIRAPHSAGLVWEPTGGLRIFLGVANNGQSLSTRPSIGIGYTVGVRRR